MNKELETLYTPLQSLNNIRYHYFHNYCGSELEYFWFNRVESALKDYEHLYQLWNCKDSDTTIIQTTKTIHDENNEKLKALEIIKEKNVDVIIIRLAPSCKAYNKAKTDISLDLDEKQFDLLKKVFC